VQTFRFFSSSQLAQFCEVATNFLQLATRNEKLEAENSDRKKFHLSLISTSLSLKFQHQQSFSSCSTAMECKASFSTIN